MKKMMMFLAAIMAAGLVQAAQIDWQFIATKDTAGYDIYFVTDVPTKIKSLADIQGSSIGHGQIAKVGKGYSASGTVVNAKWNSGEVVKYTFFATTTVDGKEYYWKSDERTASAYESPDVGNLDTFSSGLTVAGPSAAGWTQVPEPTAFALLALGVAAFGLRRKICG